MAAALAGDDLARSLSSRRSFASTSHRSWVAAASFREAWNAPSGVFNQSERQDDEEELRWAAIERLPTYDRLRKGVMRQVLDNGKVVHGEIDVTNLGMQDKKQLMESILKVVEEDNEKFLRRLRDRTDRVGIEVPKIEVRYEHLCVEGDVHVGSRALPSLINFYLNGIECNSGKYRILAFWDFFIFFHKRKEKFRFLMMLAESSDHPDDIQPWMIWGYYVSPMMYGQNAIVMNEFLDKRWDTLSIDPSGKATTVGEVLLKARGFFTEDYMFWVCIGALFGFSILFNILFIAALTFLKPVGDSKSTVIEENGDKKKKKTASGQHGTEGIDMAVRSSDGIVGVAESAPKKGMVLPFQPLSLTFNHVNYYVDMPAAVPGVAKINDGYNPATWMLEVTASSVEAQLDVDFAEIFANSSLYQRNQELIKELSAPAPGSKDLYFPTKYSQSFLTQCNACFWKHQKSYWRNSKYNAVRFVMTTCIAVLFGLIFWNMGQKTSKQQDLFNLLGAMYSAVLFLGSTRNCEKLASMAAAITGDDLARSLSSREAWNEPSGVFNQSEREDDEEALRWAAYERLPTYDRLKKGMLRQTIDNGKVVLDEIDVTNLSVQDKKQLKDSILKGLEEDNDKFLRRLRDRIDRVGIDTPKIEVRYEHLSVEGDVHVGSRALPSLINFYLNGIESILGFLHLFPQKKRKIQILNDVSGIIRPSRITLLLGPPGSGKTTLMLALSGKLVDDLKKSGKVTYCGRELTEFVPQRTCAYISQLDLHYGDMTILGLDICADIMVGNDMRRGISGGQKKRVTTGEMLVGPAKVLLMDEISTGLDSSTTFQICNSMKQMVHVMDVTMIISLLQPAPETYDLFDDIVLISEGQVVYQGPRENVLEFFEYTGFKCPDRKGFADFLQEVTSMKDQEQYWFNKNKSYKYVSVSDFVELFSSFHIGKHISSELNVPYDKSKVHPTALVREKFGISNWELLKACFAREWLLMKRSGFVFIFKTVQITIMSIIAFTVFLRTEMEVGTVGGGQKFFGALFFTLTNVMFNGMAELSMTVFGLPVFFKQRDHLFFPAWAFGLPIWLLRIPLSFLESGIWIIITYYTIGFAPSAARFFRQFIALFCIHQMGLSLFRFIAAVGRADVVANTLGTFSLLLTLVLGGFIVAKDDLQPWMKWGYYVSPMMYGQNAIVMNEFLDKRWDTPNPDPSSGVKTIGKLLLKNRSFFTEDYMFWVCIGALFGFSILFNILFIVALTFLGRKFSHLIQVHIFCIYMETDFQCIDMAVRNSEASVGAAEGATKKGMVLPFQPLSLCFNHMNYYVDMPALLLMKRGGQVIYGRPLGHNSHKLIEYFEAVPGVAKINDGHNPATWMLEITAPSVEAQMGVDFAEIFANSDLYRRNQELIKELSSPASDSKDIYFPTNYSQSFLTQCHACFWKQRRSYWRNCKYNAIRFIMTICIGVLFGIIFWDMGQKISKQQDLFNILGAMYDAMLFLGASNATSVQPVVSVERTVFYRERAAGMYSALPYAFAQVAIEIIYVTVQTVIYALILYSMIGFDWKVDKCLWFFFFILMCFSYFTLYGMSLVALTPAVQIAAILMSFFLSFWNLFAGFLVPRSQIPVWWRWFYWASPVAWTLYGILASQVDDIDAPLQIPGEANITLIVKGYLKDSYGMEHDFLPYVAIVHVCWVLLFIFLFAFGINFLNFQRR
ncbi:hypothetical protein Dsin_006633 [Dipteronia sinensis]|uniref:ABC transporter domain-containing protein n=1 Tax=Dipteronia sinensis TaxID=43782 RepID=A0AAE0AYY9_9ROSI|nr:hypothetical protein Dsin_006633 [Dipteronia sinensis]